MAGKRSRGLFFHGRKSGIGTSAVRLTTRSNFVFQTGGVLIKAAADNTAIVYIGSTNAVTADSADATDGFPISSGDSVVVEIDDPNSIFLISDTADQKVFWIGM